MPELAVLQKNNHFPILWCAPSGELVNYNAPAATKRDKKYYDS